MSLYRLVYTVLFIVLSKNIFGQKILSQHYTIANGLPSNEIFSILKDKKGLIWLGTDKGLCRFDGKTFKLYTTRDGLLENSVLEIKENKNGQIWCRTYSGLFTIIHNDSIYSAKINRDIKRLGIDLSLYQFEFDDEQNIYFGTRLNAAIYQSKYPYNTVERIISTDNPIMFFEKNSTTNIMSYTMTQGSRNNAFKINSNLLNNSITTSIDAKNVNVNYFLRYVKTTSTLFVSTNEILHIISLQNNQYKNITLPFRVCAMTLISDSTFFLGGFQGELAIFNANSNKYTLIDKLPSSISYFYYRDNACWVATLRNGIYYIPNIHYTEAFSNSEPLISMLPVNNDSLYVLKANAEIALVKKNKTITYSPQEKQNSLMYWQRFDQSQKNFIPMLGSLSYIIDKKNNKKIVLKLEQQNNWKLTELIVPTDTLIYASFFGGLRVFTQQGKDAREIQSLPSRISSLFGHDGVLYIGTVKGIYKYESNNIVSLGENPFFKNRISAIDKIGKDSILIVTQTNGIGVFDIKTNKLTIIDKTNGLGEIVIQHAFVDEEKNVWIATQQSLHKLSIKDNNVLELLDVIDLNLGELSLKEVRVFDKQVYLLTGNKIIKIPQEKIIFNTRSFPFYLNELRVNGIVKKVQNFNLFKLSPSENNLLLKYQLITYNINQTVEYRYQLNNANWIITNNNELQFGSLPSGEYSLKIEGRLRNGLWSNTIQLNFIIDKPYYKSWWFITICVITALLLAYLLLTSYYKSKFRKQLKEFELERQLESARLIASKSQMNPHFIFNALNSIQNFIIKSDKITAYTYLTDFSFLIRNYLEYSNKDYIKMDKEIDLLNTYIKIEQMRIPFDFTLHFDKNLNIENEYIYTLLLQPCIENAIWHGLSHKQGAKNLDIQISKTNNKIKIIITDNGVGRKKSAEINANRISKSQSVATNNMQNRIQSLNLLYNNNISFEIIDNYDNNNIAIGTTILLNFDCIYETN